MSSETNGEAAISLSGADGILVEREAEAATGSTSDRRRQTEPTVADIRLIVAASAAGTIFEWYDFFVYGILASNVGKAFFPGANATLQPLLVWAGFAAGMLFRPLGAILFGYFGDRLGRKYTFLATVTLMGLATASIGLIPSAARIGIAAAVLLVLLRALQGLAIGGEYGGAMVYVAEHAPRQRRGYYTSIITAGGPGGFVVSLLAVLACKAGMSEATWAGWGWRAPFLLSFGLLAISVWMRLKLSESPVFRAMKEEGSVARNPFIESFTYPGNKKRLCVALFGVSAGCNVIAYTALFVTLSFLSGAMRIEDTTAQILVGLSAPIGVTCFIFFGRLSDKVGRKLPIVFGYAFTLLLLFPIFSTIGPHANRGIAEASRQFPVTVTGPDCAYNPFLPEQPSRCGKLLDDLSATGIRFHHAYGANLRLAIAEADIPLERWAWTDKAERRMKLQERLAEGGYDLAKTKPALADAFVIVAALILLFALLGATGGPLGALLAEMFPPRIRYSSLSIPYHFGAGYFGGFVPLISAIIVAQTGDPYAGLWYPWAVVAMALAVTLWGVKSGPPAD